MNIDAKSEADDQFAIVHSLLSPSLDIRGLIAAPFGNRRTQSSLEESRAGADVPDDGGRIRRTRREVALYGEIGEYLVRRLVEWNERHSGSIEFRALGDSPAIGLTLPPDCGTWVERAGRELPPRRGVRLLPRNRAIRTYDSTDARFIFEDVFAKSQAFARR
ncbi:hypothetical protein [Nonomuraea jabiensis]|uniref:Uncharacterized protein n=1 Tax=Nonomuraea jabiensis TaxID=882448 RepID=A0A7W9G830_9ACTN|nr:hypothetical protein [Nonomuraea jabiensis]MBB5778952.1 hypothetical protein [Nonomuraea jabiensis]